LLNDLPAYPCGILIAALTKKTTSQFDSFGWRHRNGSIRNCIILGVSYH